MKTAFTFLALAILTSCASTVDTLQQSIYNDSGMIEIVGKYNVQSDDFGSFDINFEEGISQTNEPIYKFNACGEEIVIHQNGLDRQETQDTITFYQSGEPFMMFFIQDDVLKVSFDYTINDTYCQFEGQKI